MAVLAGKRCIITGGSRGIGLAIARAFASEGASCTLVGRHHDTLSRAAGSLPLATGHVPTGTQSHDAVAFDVGNEKGWLDLGPRYNRVDILVNSAGVAQNSLLFKTERSSVQDIINTNLMSTIFGCQIYSQKMMRQKSGCILNVSSLLAAHAGGGASIYAASKAGVVGLTRALASELGRFGVRINVLLPGYIHTDMTKALDEKSQLSSRIPLGRLGLPEEVAEAALFLVRNPYAHNCVLNLDGGLSAV